MPDFTPLVVFVGMNVVFFWALIDWKRPLSHMNRMRIFDRKSLRVKSSECENVIKIRGFQIDKIRYIVLRKSFLGMKMGYDPTDKKIEKLLRRLESNLAKTRDSTKKVLIEIDIDILADMRKQLASGTLVLANYLADYEEKDQVWLRFQDFPVGLALAVALFGAAIVPVAHFMDSFALFPIAGILAAENVLRRSRNKTIRYLAYAAQTISIGGAVWFAALLTVLVSINEWQLG